jgi:hypothetical protein
VGLGRQLLPQQGPRTIAPQGSISFHAERRQNAVDLVHDRLPFAAIHKVCFVYEFFNDIGAK